MRLAVAIVGPDMFGGGMMTEALDAAFGQVIRDALQPILERLTDLQTQVTALEATQAQLLAVVERAKANGWVAKLLGG